MFENVPPSVWADRILQSYVAELIACAGPTRFLGIFLIAGSFEWNGRPAKVV
jgi:hypothetical protein